jgi:tetratricopeptide (TPR) repeat protein
VRDSRGRAIASATVYLKPDSGRKTLTSRTDEEGAFRFLELAVGAYTLHAEMAGYAAAAFGSCVIGQKEVRKIDLTLGPAIDSGAPSASPGASGAEKPQFFDEPQFTVAGVTEAMNPGGHGSDAILRTTEALAKETASLGVTAPTKDSTRSPIGSASSSEVSLRKAAESERENFDVNRRLGKLLVDEGKSGDALPFLERASQLNPADYENAYELALAYANAGQYDRARTEARALLTQSSRSVQGQAEVHHLLADAEEKIGNPLEAVREYQRAAELNPSEPNVFDWGTELLIHRAFEPTIEVFTNGNRLFPRSARMLAGLGVALYARGSYDQAVQHLCEASDLNPDDPNPYLLLGKMQGVGTKQCMVEKLRRFVMLQPENAQGNYYYGLSLSKSDDANNLAQAESSLEKAVSIDPKLGVAYLQLGILYSQLGDGSKAITAYQKAAEASPGLEEAHYRLAQAYNRAGQKSKAQAELQIYQQASTKTSEEAERKRREIQQFVYTLREPASAAQPQ